jgi:membrane-bound lytic murein transglycosylase D
VAAYNCGEGNVNKAITKANSFSYDNFFIYLPAETKEHVHKFLLACYATGELETLNVPVKNIKQPAIQYAEPITATMLSGGFVLNVIANKLQLPEGILRLLNPEFENELAKTGTTSLVLPIDKMPDFLLQKNEILKASLN